MNFRTKTSGFTLIELLVVIAIIGILSSVVLASLTSARKKGIDASVKASLSNARSQAELYYSANGNSFLNVCSNTTGVGTPAVKGIRDAATAAARAAGVSVRLQSNGTGLQAAVNEVTCNDTANGWAIQAPLAASTTNAVYCVDSTGITRSINTGTMLAAGDVLCI